MTDALSWGGVSVSVDPDEEGGFTIYDGEVTVCLTTAGLRWLCLVAGPALLVEHDPHPAVERARGTAFGGPASDDGPGSLDVVPPPAEQPVDVIVPEQEHEPLTLNIEPEAE